MSHARLALALASLLALVPAAQAAPPRLVPEHLIAGPKPPSARPKAPTAPSRPSPRRFDHTTPAGPLTELVLANGLRVLLLEQHAAPVVSWVVSYNVGSRDEWAGATGSAHLLEHMLFKGTRTLGKGQVANLLARNGASFNASTGEDVTNYFETYPADKLELGLHVESARMRDALILDGERQSEMTVVRNEMERDEGDPEQVLGEAVQAVAYKAHPYHHPVIGWRADVEGVSTATLRRFYQHHYRPDNAVAVLVGDFKREAAIPLVRRYFEDLAGPAERPEPLVIAREEPQLGERRVTLRRRGETNLIQAAFHVPPVAHRDLAPLRVVDRLLAGGKAARLEQALTETGLATAVAADTFIHKDPSLFWISATLASEVPHARAEAALLGEIEKLAADPVAPDELGRAKRLAEASFVYEGDGADNMAYMLSWYATVDRWQRFFELQNQVRHVTAADVQRVARAYLTADNRTVGWYQATPDGPLMPPPENAGGGKATANTARVQPAPPFPYERRPAPRATRPLPKRYTLPGGATLLVLENPQSATVGVQGFVRAGSYLTSVKKAGLAEAVAALLTTGTARRDGLAIARDLDASAATLAIKGGVEATGVNGRMLADDLPGWLATLVEVLREPTFPEEELAKWKVRHAAAIRMAQDDPRDRAAAALSRRVFPDGHPYRQATSAERLAALDGITLADVKRWHGRYYGPNNLVLCVVGRVDAEQVRDMLADRLAGWKPGFVAPIEVHDVARQAGASLVEAMPDHTNSLLYVGHAGTVKRHAPGYEAAQLANNILGGSSLTGRLGLKLRDELGLTYGTKSTIDARAGAGPFVAHVTVNPGNVAAASKALRAELVRFAKQGVTAAELAAAKGEYVGRQAVRLATNDGMAASLAEIAKYGLPLDEWQAMPRRVEKLTLAEVNAAAKALVHPDELIEVLVGPKP